MCTLYHRSLDGAGPAPQLGISASTAELTSEIVKWNGEHHNNDIDASMVTLSDGAIPA